MHFIPPKIQGKKSVRLMLRNLQVADGRRAAALNREVSYLASRREILCTAASPAALLLALTLPAPTAAEYKQGDGTEIPVTSLP